MARLLHIDSSIQGATSVSRQLSSRAAQRWLATHHRGGVTYRDLAFDPVPHLDAAGGLARLLPQDQHTPAQAASFALSVALIDEIKEADTIILGLPLYNFGAPSSVHAWVDHLIAPGVSFDAETGEALLADTEFIVLAARGGGYGEGTPRHGWDHAEPWLTHAVSLTGLVPRFITAELTMAATNPAMVELKQLADESREQAIRAVDQLWGDGHDA